MFHGLINCNTFQWVENQCSFEEVFRFRCQAFEYRTEILFLFMSKRFNVFYCLLVSNKLIVFFFWCPDNLEYFISKLDSHSLQLILAWMGEVIDIFIRNLFLATWWRQRITGFSREKRASVDVGCCVFLHHVQELTKDTSDWPHVDGTVVITLEED